MNTEDSLIVLAIVASLHQRPDFPTKCEFDLDFDLGNFNFYADRVDALLEESIYFDRIGEKKYYLNQKGKNLILSLIDARATFNDHLSILSAIELDEDLISSPIMEDLCNPHRVIPEDLHSKIFVESSVDNDYRKAMISFVNYSYAKKHHLPLLEVDFIKIYFLSYLDKDTLNSPDFWGRLFSGMIYRNLDYLLDSISDWNETKVFYEDDVEVNSSWSFMSILYLFLTAEAKRRGFTGFFEEKALDLINLSVAI